MIRTTRTRRGVTLVELMVAAALSILGMWLLTWLYQQGIEGFRLARAQGELTGQERMVTTIMSRDLQTKHFLSDSTKPNNGLRLSDQRTDLIASGGYTPPRGGYFRAKSAPTGNGNNILEGTDSNGFTTSRSIDHFLSFTMILPGGPDSQLFSAEVPAGSGNQYFGTAAEVTYYLSSAYNGLTTPSGLPLYDLYRQQRLSAQTSDIVAAYNNTSSGPNTGPAAQPYANEVMTALGSPPGANGLGPMWTLIDLTVPQGTTSNTTNMSSVRLPGPTFTPISSSARLGSDKILSNVLSFEVKFTGPSVFLGAGAFSPSDPTSTTWPRPFNSGNSDSPYDTLPFDGLYDTHSQQVSGATVNWYSPGSNTNPAGYATVPTTANPAGYPTGIIKPIRITGVMIRIRAYDSRTQSTRQTTITIAL